MLDIENKGQMKQINWGFIGCGEVTEKKSGPAFNEVMGSHVVAVFSRSEMKARSYAERQGIRKWYTDAQALVDDPDVNAIYIATPPSAHATFAIMAMRAGKPCYIEKPLAASYEIAYVLTVCLNRREYRALLLITVVTYLILRRLKRLWIVVNWVRYLLYRCVLLSLRVT